jgi:sugar lactone lactonase YvrE
MNVFKPLAALTLLCLQAIACIGQDVQRYYTEAKKALENKDHAQFYASIMQAYDLHPYNQNILWHAGLAAALTNRSDEAIAFLVRAINIDANYDLANPNLSSIKSLPAFQQLSKSKDMLNRPVIRSDTAFILEDRQLHLESIAFDPIGKALYGGSIHKRKIIKVDEQGGVSDFTLAEQYNIASVFGLKIDTCNKILWACSSAVPEMQHYDSSLASSLVKFDLNTKQLLKSYQPADTLSGHIFGDVILDSKGAPYVSNSKNNLIYKYDQGLNSLIPYFTSTEFWNIQGLAFSEHDKALFISDYIKGIYKLDTKTMKVTKMSVAYDLSLKGSDGIYYFRNSLITVQNGVQPNRVVRHFIGESGTEFVKYEYIDNAHPAFGEPTTGTFSGDTFYYIANSQWNGYDKGKIKAAKDLSPTVILKQSLK